MMLVFLVMLMMDRNMGKLTLGRQKCVDEPANLANLNKYTRSVLHSGGVVVCVWVNQIYIPHVYAWNGWVGAMSLKTCGSPKKCLSQKNMGSKQI